MTCTYLYLKLNEHHQVVDFDGPIQRVNGVSLPPDPKVIGGTYEMLTGNCNPPCKPTKPRCCYVNFPGDSSGWACQASPCRLLAIMDSTDALLFSLMVPAGKEGIDYETCPAPEDGSIVRHMITWEVFVISTPGEPKIYALEGPQGVVAVRLTAPEEPFLSSSAQPTQARTAPSHSHSH